MPASNEIIRINFIRFFILELNYSKVYKFRT